MCDEGYQGYSNRETWAVSLWLNNDEYYYNLLRELVDQVTDEFDDSVDQEYELADRIKDLWERFTDPEDDLSTEDLVAMIKDVGSLWRVDWNELAKSELAD